MNSNFKIKLLQNITSKNVNKGTTLTELLICMIIMAILAAIALPNLLGQMAKGKQAEAKSNIGAINRGQQSYRAEKGVFAPITPPTSAVGVKTSWHYYTFGDLAATNVSYASYNAGAIAGYANDIKNYAAAVNQDSSGIFVAIIGESVGTAAAAGTVVISAGSPTAAVLSVTTGNQVN